MSQIIQVRQDMLCTKDDLINKIFLWIPTHRHISFCWPVKNYIHQLYADTGCYLEDLPKVIANKNRWEESQWNPFSVYLDDHDYQYD